MTSFHVGLKLSLKELHRMTGGLHARWQASTHGAHRVLLRMRSAPLCFTRGGTHNRGCVAHAQPRRLCVPRTRAHLCFTRGFTTGGVVAHEQRR